MNGGGGDGNGGGGSVCLCVWYGVDIVGGGVCCV